MTFNIARLAGVLFIGASLAGCMDMTAEIDVSSETTGTTTTTMTMNAKSYAEAVAGGADGGGFCPDAGVLTENADGTATCTVVSEGNFAELADDNISFTVVSPGVVRVAFDTGDASSQATGGQAGDVVSELARQFEGHDATIRIKGKRIVETNLTRVGDTAAEIVIPLSAVFDGTATLPDELYAVVDTR